VCNNEFSRVQKRKLSLVSDNVTRKATRTTDVLFHFVPFLMIALFLLSDIKRRKEEEEEEEEKEEEEEEEEKKTI